MSVCLRQHVGKIRVKLPGLLQSCVSYRLVHPLKKSERFWRTVTISLSMVQGYRTKTDPLRTIRSLRPQEWRKHILNRTIGYNLSPTGENTQTRPNCLKVNFPYHTPVPCFRNQTRVSLHVCSISTEGTWSRAEDATVPAYV